MSRLHREEPLLLSCSLSPLSFSTFSPHSFFSVSFSLTGRNATEVFEDVGHSIDARELQKSYMIGVVIPEKVVVRVSEHPTLAFS